MFERSLFASSESEPLHSFAMMNRYQQFPFFSNFGTAILMNTRVSGIALQTRCCILFAFLLSSIATAQGPGRPDMAALQAASQADRQKMMDLLEIKSLRPGKNGSNPQAPNAANYDESKANPFPELPDPLKLNNGKSIATAEEWQALRRKEIVEHFDREVYGRVPKETPAVKWEVTSSEESEQYETKVLTKKLVGRVDNQTYPDIQVEIQLTLTLPADAKSPVPVVMQFGFAGFGRPGTAPAGNRPQPPNPWQKQVLARGWGYAILVPNSIQADNGAGLTAGIIGLCNKGNARKPDDWGALRAWAWGASRAMDYLESDPQVDAKRVAVQGHSRYGKASIVAMAYDPRISTGYISSSGAGGAKLHRRDYGEIIENVCATSEYHWMAGNYLKYAGPLNWGDLPVDSHELVALCAPRPIFLSAGAAGDGWVDAKGTFLAGVGAAPVYALFGKKGLGTTEFPATETSLVEGEIAFRQHAGGHIDGPNWPIFLDFASRTWQPQSR